MTKKQKKMLIRIIIAAVLLIALNFIPVKGILRMILFLIPYLVIGYERSPLQFMTDREISTRR